MVEASNYRNLSFSKEAKTLSKELFFHGFGDHHQSQVLHMSNHPLFGLKGRATISRGSVHRDGMFACYKVPLDLQKKLFTSPFDSGYESWAHGSKTMLALKQSVPIELREEVDKWLEVVRDRAPYKYHEDIPLKDIVFLPSDFFVAGFYIGSGDLDFYESGKGFSRRVNKIVMTNTNDVVDSSILLEAMQHYHETV